MDIEKAKEELKYIQDLCSAYETLIKLKEKSIELDKQLKTKEREYVPIPLYPMPDNPLNPPDYFNPPYFPYCSTSAPLTVGL